VLFIEAVICYV